MYTQNSHSPKVFISYSWDSPEHKDRVLALSDHLRRDGIDCTLDQYEFSPSEGWPRWMERQIQEADFILVVCTETYRRRCEGRELPGQGNGVRWEGHLTYQHIYNTGTLNHRFIPVLLGSAKCEDVPMPLAAYSYYRTDTPEGYENLYRHLTNQPRHLRPELGSQLPLPPRERTQDFSREFNQRLFAQELLRKLRRLIEEIVNNQTFDHNEDHTNMGRDGNSFRVRGTTSIANINVLDENSAEISIPYSSQYLRGLYRFSVEYNTERLHVHGTYRLRLIITQSDSHLEKLGVSDIGPCQDPKHDSNVMTIRGLEQKIIAKLLSRWNQMNR